MENFDPKIGDCVVYIMDGKQYVIMGTHTQPYKAINGDIYPNAGTDYLCRPAVIQAGEVASFSHFEKRYIEPCPED